MIEVMRVRETNAAIKFTELNYEYTYIPWQLTRTDLSGFLHISLTSKASPSPVINNTIINYFTLPFCDFMSVIFNVEQLSKSKDQNDYYIFNIYFKRQFYETKEAHSEARCW
jgi:hypothetical protein